MTEKFCVFVVGHTVLLSVWRIVLALIRLISDWFCVALLPMRSPSAAVAAASISPDLSLRITIKVCDGFLSFEFRGE